MEASRIGLEPLTEEESRSLLGGAADGRRPAGGLRQRVLDRAEGNPLFVEEVVRMLIEEGVVEHRDGIGRDEGGRRRARAGQRRGADPCAAGHPAVAGARGAAGGIGGRSDLPTVGRGRDRPPDQVPPRSSTHLEDAILRDLITEERTPDEPTFRFRHILIRDVAYATLPKARRAELHAPSRTGCAPGRATDRRVRRDRGLPPRQAVKLSAK